MLGLSGNFVEYMNRTMAEEDHAEPQVTGVTCCGECKYAWHGLCMKNHGNNGDPKFFCKDGRPREATVA